MRAAPGGAVSSRLVYGWAVGDQIHLAAPVGDRLTLWSAGSADLLLLAGGTGWASVKALVEQGGRYRPAPAGGVRAPGGPGAGRW
ncbi:hypothetical protein [Micromonospora deserti]|uniref:hypothetical protein n=1 Tax=Micromonospora deserti TaxID=2070366 RepID=UPI001F1B3126|nr:hypothetical protein [Micromonospora deserti]